MWVAVALPAGRQEERQAGLSITGDHCSSDKPGGRSESRRLGVCAQPEIAMILGEEEQMSSAVTSAVS